MNSESVSLCLFEIGTEGSDTTLRALPVLESGSGLRLDKSRRDLNSAVEVGGYDVLLLSGRATAMFDFLKAESALCQTKDGYCDLRMNQICILGHSA